MLVGVLSDTHDNLKNVEKVARIIKKLNVDMVIHLGDIIAPFTLAKLASELEGIKITAIFGNNCGEKSGLYNVAKAFNIDLLEPPTSIKINDKKILLIHGWGPAEMTEEIVEALASSGKWDVILYGHTHKSRIDYIKGKLVLNPGEVAGALYEPSFALLDIDLLKAKIIKVE